MTSVETTKTNTGTAATFNRRLEETGWALFLIMIGALLLLPEGLVPDGTWLVGTGLIMIGMNVVRHLHGLRVSGFTAVLGLVALAVGVSAIAAVDLPVFPILLVAIGAHIVYNVTKRN